MISPDILTKAPAAFNASAAGTTSATIQFLSSGPAYAVIKDGTCTIHEGQADKADLTIKASDSNLVDLLIGKMKPAMGVMMGKISATGNLDLGLKLTSFFDFSRVT